MSWSVVCTTNAPVQDIARFAAHHLAEGCTALYLFLDGAVPGIQKLRHPMLHIRRGDSGSSELHQRQMANANWAYRAAQTDWIAHFDIDEFLIIKRPFGQPLGAQLAALPPSAEWASLYSVEPLIPEGDTIRYYKRSPRQIGLPRAVLEELYPDYGLLLRSGFLGYDTGKPIARTGLPHARLGIHKLLGSNKPHRIDAVIAHHHALHWPGFKAALPARLANGSYSAAYKGFPTIAEVINALKKEGPEALKAFYDSLRASTPEHIEALEKHGLLLQHELKLDHMARAMFPAVFAQEVS